MKVATKSGFKATVNENLIKDWRFVTLTSKIKTAEDEIESINAVDKALNFLLGEKGAQKLLTHIAKIKGVADVESVIGEYTEILAQLTDQPWETENDGYFCHVARFLIAAPPKESAIKMCQIAADA